MVSYQNYQPLFTTRKREAIEWSDFYAYGVHEPEKPRILMIGDSICSGYQHRVRERLAGRVNGTVWVSSKCVTDPDYFRVLNFVLGSYSYDLITFNNGLHSFSTPAEEWRAAYSDAAAFIRARVPAAQLVLVSTTPLKDANLTARSAKMSEHSAFTARAYGLPFIDLFTPLDPLDREEYWADTFHFRDAAKDMQADLIAGTVCRLLKL